MIEPFRIKDEYKKVEKENYRFRTYLKIHADKDELDKQFLELHNELFENYDCNKCRNCCREYAMVFEEGDINSAAKELRITKDEAINKYIKITVNGYESKDKTCCFLELVKLKVANLKDAENIHLPINLKNYLACLILLNLQVYVL